MTTAREFAIDLRATARDIEEESTTLEAACSKSFTPLPQRIVLAEHQRGFFPDIENFLTDPIGDYLVALDGAQLALETWNTGCTNQVVDTDRVIDLARAVVESTDAALNIRIPDLRDNPFVTPTPSPRPTNTPTNTPEPSPTPLPRSREDIIRQMYTIVEHAQVNADIVFNSTRDALRNNNLRDYCQTERFWDDVVLITLTGDEVETAADIATYLEDTQNGFSTTISQSQAMLAEWERLCRSGKPSDVELDALNRLAQSVQEEIRKAQTSLLNTFGPKPE
ncbi:MAG: hypothetical protein CUN55_01405 [Phototrophicales bacterium]|nr:MAG: hypothetical protein CUN55_01405 [Phototrophicales bacterium]